MKRLIFELNNIKKDQKLISGLKYQIFKYPIIPTFFNYLDIYIKSNIYLEEDISLKYKKVVSDTNDFSVFILNYIFNILSNNRAALNRKKPPYDLVILSTICFETQQFQLYIYLDDAIFGLVIGKKFNNVIALIRTLFPISAKMELSNELRFFPISRLPSK